MRDVFDSTDLYFLVGIVLLSTGHYFGGGFLVLMSLVVHAERKGK